MSKIQEIKERLLKNQSEQEEASRLDWQEFTDHPLLYTALIVSGFLSALAGLAIGLGLRMENGNAIINTDVPHLFFALLYAILFPYFFEFGLANWLSKLLHREPDNKVQQVTSIAMVGITGIGTALTAFSAMDVLVTSLGFFTAFQEIPAQVQKWIAFSLPAMLMLNIAAGELYRQNSEAAKLEREAEKEYNEARIEADNEIKLARMEAKKQIALRAASEYSRQAAKEVESIGAKRGAQDWNKDRAKFNPQGAPMVANAANTRQEELQDKNPTNGG